jgi:hypothetical protein
MPKVQNNVRKLVVIEFIGITNDRNRSLINNTGKSAHIVRENSTTKEVIQSAWKKSGLLPYDPDVVLSQIPPKEIISPINCSRGSLT